MDPSIYKFIKPHFPHEEFNTGQDVAIAKIISALKRGVKHVVLEAPTGTGKSAIAVTIHNIMQTFSQWHRTSLVTVNLGLQDQYVNDYGTMFDLKGKRNYKCLESKEENVFYSSGKCHTILNSNNGSCSARCPYVVRRNEWLSRSNFRLTNAQFVITAPTDYLQGEHYAPLMIIDECHQISNVLVENATLNINRDFISTTARRYKDMFENLFNNMFEVFMTLPVGESFKTSDIDMDPIREFYGRMDYIKEQCLERLSDGDQDPDLIIINDEIGDILGNMEAFIEVDGEWILTEYVVDEEDDTLIQKCSIKPVYAHQVSQRGLFGKAEQFVHMSATICGFKEYCFNLGINPSEAVYIEIDNPIPLENRPVYIHSKISINRETRSSDIGKMVDEVIAKNNYNTSGVIHTVSFKLADQIIENSRYSDRMTISNNREEILELLGAGEDHIILSPSIEVGYDFKDDLARWQIIAKVPYLYLGDPFVALNRDRDQNWYSRQAILRLVQASGRVVRGVTDFGDTHVLDGNVNRLIRYNSYMFPKWYLDAIEKV